MFSTFGLWPICFQIYFCKNHFRCPATRTPCLGSSFRWRAVAVCGSYRTLLVDASSILIRYSSVISCGACRPFLLETFHLFQLFRLLECNYSGFRLVLYFFSCGTFVRSFSSGLIIINCWLFHYFVWWMDYVNSSIILLLHVIQT